MNYLQVKYTWTHVAKTGVLMLFILFFKLIHAQTPAEEQIFNCSNNNCIITLNYQPQGVVSNLLIQISDSGGRTIFLDNKYKFSGTYRCVYNASEWKDDVIYVQLIADDKHFNKEIKVK